MEEQTTIIEEHLEAVITRLNFISAMLVIYLIVFGLCFILWVAFNDRD